MLIFFEEKSMPKLLAALLCAVPVLSQAQIYKWVDAKGVTHYSDNKYAAGNAPVVELRRNSAPSAVLPANVTWQERDAEFRRLQQHKLMAPAIAHASSCRRQAKLLPRNAIEEQYHCHCAEYLRGRRHGWRVCRAGTDDASRPRFHAGLPAKKQQQGDL
jgi:hypothetical protein